jgi:hypothetical protein
MRLLPSRDVHPVLTWVRRLRYFAAVPGPRFKAVSDGPAPSTACWTLYTRMWRSGCLSAVVAVRFSCQDHIGPKLEDCTSLLAAHDLVRGKA